MATRFNLPTALSAPVKPAFDASWNQTAEATRYKLVFRPNQMDSTALANQVVTIPITTTQNILSSQFVSDPLLGAQSISGTISAVVRVLESALTANAFLQLVAYVVSRDGLSVTGSLFSGATDVEFAATAATRINSANAITTVNANDGDRIVIEIGVAASAPTAATTGTFRYGTSPTTDFALTSALTTDLRPWVELSSTLTMGFSGYKMNPNKGLRPHLFSPGIAR